MALNRRDEAVLWYVSRPLKHHVLEQVRKARLTGLLNPAADIVAQRDTHNGDRTIGLNRHPKAVGQGALMDVSHVAKVR